MDKPVRFWKRVQKSSGCWLWTGARSEKGYGRFGDGLYAHRIAWEWAFGPIPDGKWVLHQCDNPACVKPSHLFLGDNLANMRDCAAKGRQARGSGHGRAKLNEQQVREIRRARAAGVRGQDLARQYGVSEPTISGIVTGTEWAHLR